ncbi:interferon-inducible protein AIM2 [Nannospalax galili]|uniref:interferon-inducible protein AIM2 n=1 Tax=Nannospalax galili TaxID=1026970 RepID=UPI0004ED10AB|nr:interferon-inducible protein AIM2 [Nannospalax galili]
MESKYKEMLLLTGLDNITEEELQRFKFFLPDKFKLAKSKVAAANRIELADLMIQSVGAASAVNRTILIFQKLNFMQVAKCLQEEKEKVDNKCKPNPKNGTKQVEKCQTEAHPVVSATMREDGIKKPSTEVSPPAKPQKKQMVAKQESIGSSLQQGPLTVLVLKAMKPFVFETQGRKQKMFHATVATEREFFFVKVFNIQLKDKFTPKRIIIISNYHWHSGYLEVDSSSIVIDDEPDHQVSVPKHIIRKAGETPKINKLQSQPHGTIVNGVFVVQKKTEEKDSVLYDVNDNTGEMAVLVLGNQSKLKCEEGDKLRLTFFEVSKCGEELQLISGPHSFLKVIKAKKNPQRLR